MAKKKKKKGGAARAAAPESGAQGAVVWAAPVAIILAAVAVYSNTMAVPFHFDDRPHIVDNYFLRDFANFWPPSGTRYISFLSFAFNYQAGGLDPFGYHVTNTAVHAANGVLLWWFMTLTFKTPVMKRAGLDSSAVACAAFAAAVVFTVHPLQTQAVTYITQRFASMTTIFYLLAVTLYVRARLNVSEGGGGPFERSGGPFEGGGGKGNIKTALLIALSFVSAVFAMKTKEIAFTLPFVAALYEWTFFDDKKIAERIKYLTPLLLTALIIPATLFGPDIWSGAGGGGITEQLRETQLKDLSTISRHDYLVTQMRVIVVYISLLILPVGQSLYHDYGPYTSLLTPSVLFSFLFLAAIFFGASWTIYRQRAVGGWSLMAAFGIIWFFMTISVESSIIPINDVIFEHRVYLPSVGAAICFGCAVFYCFERWRARYGLTAVVLIAALPLAVAAHMRNEVWADGLTLWTDVVEKSPGLEIAHRGLGSAYERAGRHEEAIEEFLKALEIEPGSLEATYNLANAYREVGRLEEAARAYRYAIEAAPHYTEARNNLAITFTRLGRIEEALKQFREAVKRKPDHVNARYNLATIYYNTGRTDEAIAEFKKTLGYDPDYIRAYVNLGNSYKKKNMLDDAAGAYMGALRVNPMMPEALNNLGNVYTLQGRYQEATRAYEKVLTVRPGNVATRTNLAQAYLKLGRWEDAGREAAEAVRLKPDYVEARLVAALIDEKAGRSAKAESGFRWVLEKRPGHTRATEGLRRLSP